MSPLARAAAGMLVAYGKYLSPLSRRHCRWEPTCSRYGLTAVQTHGALRGGALAAGRLLRCGPWSGGGFDPVPGTRTTGALDKRWEDRGRA